jgi:DNA-binding response OmpR family regulator
MSEKRNCILIVDDDRGIREYYREAFENEGFIVHAAEDGMAAIDKFLKCAPDIDIVVLDIMLPRMSGWDVLETIRKCPEDGMTPVILHSGSVRDIDRFMADPKPRCLFVQKPAKLDSLLQIIRGLLD